VRIEEDAAEAKRVRRRRRSRRRETAVNKVDAVFKAGNRTRDDISHLIA
jgi:hypothetical protein